MINYKWTIARLDRTIPDGGVITAHWRVTAADGTFSAWAYGTAALTPIPNDSYFKPYKNLTEDDVLAWVWGMIDRDAVEASLSSQIDAQKHPDVATGLPWGGFSSDVRFVGTAPLLQPQPVFSDPKFIGVEFDGIMCSATKEDQSGLMAVLMAIQLQGAAFPPTRFEFANGNTLVISRANHQAFLAVWLPFRQSFFTISSDAD